MAGLAASGWYNDAMRCSSRHTRMMEFVKTTTALACLLLTTSLMNDVVFPRFDEAFTYARDISVLANSVALVVIGLVATFRPSALRANALRWAAVGCLVASAVLLPASLRVGNAVGLTVSASFAAVGRSWIVVVVGMAASRFALRRAGVCVALAFVAYYTATAFSWAVPTAAGVVLFLVLPLASLALTWRCAMPMLKAAEMGDAPIDFSITQPSSFLPLGSQLFACLFLFRVAFGYSLRFGEVEGVPLSDALAIVPVAAVAVAIALSRATFPADLLTQASVLLVVAGFFASSMSHDLAPMASVTLLSAGNALFDMVAWVVLIAVAGRNERGALAAFAWGRGLTGLGTVVGASLGVLANGLVGDSSFGFEIVIGALILVFVGYALIGLKSFSFSSTIEGVTPVDGTVAKAPERDFEARCREVAERFGLSPRELEVFMMLARGRDRAYIQERLVVSRNTVKAHVKHVYAKLGIHTHQELIDLVEE